MTILTAIGLTSGASLSGVEAALLKTDGEQGVEIVAHHIHPYDRDMKILLNRAAKAAGEGRDGAADIGKAAGELTNAHVVAVEELLGEAGLKRTMIDVIGFHGHTILHRPRRSPDAVGRTWQIGDGRVGLRRAIGQKVGLVAAFRRRVGRRALVGRAVSAAVTAGGGGGEEEGEQRYLDKLHDGKILIRAGNVRDTPTQRNSIAGQGIWPPRATRGQRFRDISRRPCYPYQHSRKR